MSRISEMKNKLNDAPTDILSVLAGGLLKTGDFINQLGYSTADFYFTKAIGDNRGEWDDSVHQWALSDLIEKEEVQWQYDEHLNVCYALKDTWLKEECGEDSFSLIRIEKFLKKISNLIAIPILDKDGNFNVPRPRDVNQRSWDLLSFNICEISNKKGDDCRNIYCDGEKVIVLDYHFVVGVEGKDKTTIEFVWPEIESNPEKVAEAVLTLLKEEQNEDKQS